MHESAASASSGSFDPDLQAPPERFMMRFLWHFRPEFKVFSYAGEKNLALSPPDSYIIMSFRLSFSYSLAARFTIIWIFIAIENCSWKMWAGEESDTRHKRDWLILWHAVGWRGVSWQSFTRHSPSESEPLSWSNYLFLPRTDSASEVEELLVAFHRAKLQTANKSRRDLRSVLNIPSRFLSFHGEKLQQETNICMMERWRRRSRGRNLNSFDVLSTRLFLIFSIYNFAFFKPSADDEHIARRSELAGWSKQTIAFK